MRSEGWYRLAMALGLLHAAASAYWAAGGDALLSTVGRWAVRLRDEHSAAALAAGLGAVALAKAAAAVVPWWNHRGRMPRPRLWRRLAWAGAVLLIAYGAANIAGGVVGLAGWAGEPGDRAALWGHVALWDPLFALWGLALLAALVTERREGAAVSRAGR